LHARRSKEEADDYRYFPEPDLVPLEPSAETVARLREAMPELPAARTARFRGDYGLSAQDAADLNAAPAIADYFEAVAALGDDPKTAADWVRNQPAAVGTIPPAGIAGIVRLIGAGTITATIAKQVYALLEADPRADPAALVRILFGLGEMVTATQSVQDETLALLGAELDFDVQVVSPEDEDRELLEGFDLEFGADEGDEGDLAQVVTDSEVASKLSFLRASLQAQVATALDQIALGRYGICEDCREDIPAERMEFLPETTRCVRCQAVKDRRAS